MKENSYWKYTPSLERLVNAFELVGVLLALIFASLIQFALNELPCPLCLLQRIGFVLIAYGFLLNMRFGCRASHYSIVILSALFTSFVSLRQIALHVIPGTGAYGDAFLGVHLYTWCFIAAMLVVIGTTLLWGICCPVPNPPENSKKWNAFMKMIYIVSIVVVVINIVSVLTECGLHACPDNPTSYILFRA